MKGRSIWLVPVAFVVGAALGVAGRTAAQEKPGAGQGQAAPQEAPRPQQQPAAVDDWVPPRGFRAGLTGDIERIEQRLGALEKELHEVVGATRALRGKVGGGTASAGATGKSGDEDEARAIVWLRKLVTAQTLFREGDRDNNGVLDYASNLDLLFQAHLFCWTEEDKPGTHIDDNMKMDGYWFRILHADVFKWTAVAEPATGKGRFFGVDESGVIRAESGRSADANSPPLQQ